MNQSVQWNVSQGFGSRCSYVSQDAPCDWNIHLDLPLNISHLGIDIHGASGKHMTFDVINTVRV